MVDNISEMVTNALVIDKKPLFDNCKNIINEIKNNIINNKDLLEDSNEIDINNDNGIQIDFDVIERIFKIVLQEGFYYGKVILSQKNDEKNIIYGKELLDRGLVAIITDGNPYVILELALRNILAGNSIIFVDKGSNFGINNFLIKIIQNTLEQFNISKYLIQIYHEEDYQNVLSNYANINLVICIGDRNLQNYVLKNSNIDVIVSGYNYFDLYIEDDSHNDFIDKIINTNLNINLYTTYELEDKYPSAIVVQDIDEAICQINYNGNKYGTAIFTSDANHASKFIRNIKSSYVTVNTSPTIEQILDIKQKDLLIEKTIIYPVGFKFDKNKIDIKF